MFSQEDLDRMQQQYENSGSHQKEIFNKFLSYIYSNNDNSQNNYKDLSNDLGVAYIHEKTYTIEGGSCWDEVDEDNTYEINVSEKVFKENLSYKAQKIINLLDDLNLNLEQVETWKKSNIENIGKYSYVTDYFSGEYYGNGSNYGIYKIDYNTLIAAVCSEKDKGFYQEALQSFIAPVKNKNKYKY